MVWRYHPVSREYELFSEGSGNVFGLELDGEGRLFSGTTDRRPAAGTTRARSIRRRAGCIDCAGRIRQIEEVLRKAPGNPYVGEALFQQRCAACHRLFFKGGFVGPDLTSYQRDHLGTLLTSILDPSAEIR